MAFMSFLALLSHYSTVFSIFIAGFFFGFRLKYTFPLLAHLGSPVSLDIQAILCLPVFLTLLENLVHLDLLVIHSAL